MHDIPLDLAYTSPLLRAKETAQIILRDRNIPLCEDERLQEISFGSYEGLSAAANRPMRKVRSSIGFLTIPRIIFLRQTGKRFPSSMSGQVIS